MMKPPIIIQASAEQHINELIEQTRYAGLVRQSRRHWRGRIACVLYGLAEKLEPTPHPTPPHAA